jgi:hypothetical protein
MVNRGLALGARDYLVKSATTPITLSEKVKSIVPPGAPGGPGASGSPHL